jgi:putative DNA methylase
MSDRRFIEESFPVKEVGEISAKEKNIRHGHISTLHIWWARRPLAASRATAYAALTPAPKDIEEWQKKRDFIIELSKWENSNNQTLLDRARKDILEAHAERLSEETGKTVTVEDIEAGRAPRPRVLDPFAGGGSYPLEALRLGCETYANDYNPVAVLIEKATLEFPQKFGRPFEGMPEWASPGATERRFGKGNRRTKQVENAEEDFANQPVLFGTTRTDSDLKSHNPLLEGVRYWGNWMLEEARKELAEFYPPDSDGSIPIGYIWARTIPCQNPACGAEIPLIRQYWLVNKDKKKVALYPDTSNRELEFRIVGDGYEAWPAGFDPEQGTVKRAFATCLYCGSVVDDDTTRALFRQKKSNQRMIAVVLQSNAGKTYRTAGYQDIKFYNQAEVFLDSTKEKLFIKWGIDPLPEESIPTTELRRISLPLYGLCEWKTIFNSRQSLALIEFSDKVRQVYEKIVSEVPEPDFAIAITTYLALSISRMSDFESMLCRWQSQWEFIPNTFSRQAIAMTWDYAELNPLSPVLSGTFESMLRQVLSVIETCSDNQTDSKLSKITQNSATDLPYLDNYFDVVLTDPPYYDNVPYSHLSDFFYVWLKRSLGNIYQDLFSTPLTPKSQEIVQDRRHSLSPAPKTKEFFERGLSQAFKEIKRLLKPQGLALIVYAHKSTDGWETVINALLDSGLVVTGSWPINTEMSKRLNSQETASLASSIYIVARKIARKSTGFYNDVRLELSTHLDTKLHRLWEEGIGGADFFIAAIGSAIEIFGKYEQVIDYEGNVVRADRLLDEVRSIATDYAVRQILHNGFATEISDLARLYVLWRWNYQEALVPFDEARKLAQSCGLDLSQLWGKGGFIKKEKEFVRLLGPQQRKLYDLNDPRDLIDVLHKALLLWEQSKRVEMIQALAESGHGKSEAFYRVAQAISETLPNESKEKKLLDGFLAGRERVQQEVEKVERQGRLWEEGGKR